MNEEPFIEECRRRVEEQYAHTKLGSGSIGGCFGSILCSELHGPSGDGLDFRSLAEKWGISLPVLGELIWDHCKRLEPQLRVNHNIIAISSRVQCTDRIADDRLFQQPCS